MMLTSSTPSPTKSSSNLKLHCVTNIGDFRKLEDEWGKLFATCANASLFSSWEWLFSWWQAYERNNKLNLLIWREHENKDLVGIAPLYLSTIQVIPGIPVKILQFVGDGSGDSDYLDFLVHPGDYFNAVIGEFSQWLFSNKEWDVLVLNTISPNSLLPQALEKLAQIRNLPFRSEPQRCAMTLLPSEYEKFLTTLRPRFRTKVRSLLRMYDTNGSLNFEEDISNLRRRLRSLFSLHQLRWQQEGQSGVFSEKEKRRFYGQFVTRFARKGWLHFYSLRNGNQYLAHELCFGRNGDAFLLQEGFDVSDAKASFGQMLRALVFRSLINHGGKKYDFLGGYSRHKSDWGALQAEMTRLVLARGNWRSRIYFYLPGLREKIAQRVKRVLPETVLRLLRK